MDIRSPRKTITQPIEWWEAFRRQADREGMTLSAWIGDCCAANVPEKLTDRPPANRPKKSLAEETGERL